MASFTFSNSFYILETRHLSDVRLVKYFAILVNHFVFWTGYLGFKDASQFQDVQFIIVVSVSMLLVSYL